MGDVDSYHITVFQIICNLHTSYKYMSEIEWKNIKTSNAVQLKYAFLVLRKGLCCWI